MGVYRVSIPRHNGHVSRDYALRRALQIAQADRVEVSGDPIIRTRRALPLIGSRRAYIVTFPTATRETD